MKNQTINKKKKFNPLALAIGSGVAVGRGVAVGNGVAVAGGVAVPARSCAAESQASEAVSNKTGSRAAKSLM